MRAPYLSINSIHFTDVSEKYNVKGYNYFGGHGICWVDVNGDGKLDIYVKNVGGKIYNIPNNLFINYGDYFSEEANIRGVSDSYGLGTHGAVFADFDNDEDLDLVSTTTFSMTPSYNHLYQNDGSGFFYDITSAITPPQDTNVSCRGVAAADFDCDGDIDFYFSDALENPYAQYSFLLPPEKLQNFYINNEDGTFSPEYRGISWSGFVQGVTAIDIDGDGDIDIAEARWTPPSTIYLNNGKGHFIDSGQAMGLPSCLGVHDNGMTFGDIDNDGDLDLAIIGEGRVDIYKNKGSYFVLFQSIGLNNNKSGFHVSFGDFDHDGKLDMYVSGGNVYKNNGAGFFSLVPANISGLNASLDMRDPRSCALGDFDNDGDLDIYATDKHGYNVLFRNDCNDSNWIQVDVIGHTGGIDGIGTKLDLYIAGHVGETQFLKGHREIQGEYGYLGQDMSIVHFGASASLQYDLKLTFLDNTERIIKNINPPKKVFVSYPFVYPPINFKGIRKDNEILFYREKGIYLTWEKNPKNENIIKYRIYIIQNGERTLLEEVSANTFSFFLRTAQDNKQYEFALTAVNKDNKEGNPAYVTVN